MLQDGAIIWSSEYNQYLYFAIIACQLKYSRLKIQPGLLRPMTGHPMGIAQDRYAV